MNGFEQHNITHLSPSSINLWINAPDRWVVEKLFKRKGSMSAAAYRGNAVEAGVVCALMGEPFVTAAGVAHACFEDGLRLDPGNAGVEKERDAIEPMMVQALDALADLKAKDPAAFGDYVWPKNKQHMVSRIADLGDGVAIKWIGYLDILTTKCVIDLKTTFRINSVMTPEHQRQRAFYSLCANRPVTFLYASPKRAEAKQDGDVSKRLAEMKWHARRLENLLRDRTPEQVAALVPVNLSSFYWRGCESDAYEIFGLPNAA